ncbi:uncharacterized protein HaLaN_00756 [Haematococcus lacustris]|uniref:Uncharacterized protein n=1 Tax=Haematococcus lacustris TaxID=44745 RepID=A0A699YA08_HAELA|nr:uncharacterized protein HaLaN_00756 [Haematococcus lacustris]
MLLRPPRYSAADDDDRNMEVSFQQIAAEERRSAKLGRKEDLLEELREQERLRAKAKRQKV